MTEDEIAERLQAGGLKLSFDTNAIEGDERRDAICDNVSRWNIKLAERSLALVSLVVCAVAHHEKVFHLKQRFRGTFKPSVILDGLKKKSLITEPYDAQHAMETGAWIGERYPTQNDWYRAKKERSLRSLGLDPITTKVPASGKGCGATVDWLIIGHARAEGCVLVSDDMGPEFAELVERVKLGTLERALAKLVSEAS
jgi:hypothetical protein